MKKEEIKSISKFKNKIVCSDASDFLKKLPDKCTDLVVTDPPYGVDRANWDAIAPIHWCKEIKRIMKDDASLLIFCGKQNRFEVEKALRESGLTFWQETIWVYRNGGVTRKSAYNGHHEPILGL